MDTGAMYLTFPNEQCLFTTFYLVPRIVLHVFQEVHREEKKNRINSFKLKGITFHTVNKPQIQD